MFLLSWSAFLLCSSHLLCLLSFWRPLSYPHTLLCLTCIVHKCNRSSSQPANLGGGGGQCSIMFFRTLAFIVTFYCGLYITVLRWNKFDEINKYVKKIVALLLQLFLCVSCFFIICFLALLWLMDIVRWDSLTFK
jgi:hypothetical protein